MTNPCKLLFDENFGRPLVGALKTLLDFHDPCPELAHLFDIVPPGTADELWIPEIAPANWIVVSSDRARQCGGAKLPALCIDFGVTHVLLGASLHNAKQFEKARAIVTVWPEILALPKAAAGSRYSLRVKSNANHAVLVPVPLPPQLML